MSEGVVSEGVVSEVRMKPGKNRAGPEYESSFSTWSLGKADAAVDGNYYAV